jgi:hypothetical protein
MTAIDSYERGRFEAGRRNPDVCLDVCLGVVLAV